MEPLAVIDDTPATPQRHRLSIDWTVNLTTLASIAIALATGVVTVTQIQAQNDKRLSLLEAGAVIQHTTDTAQDARMQQELTLIRQSLQRIEEKQDASLLRRAHPSN